MRTETARIENGLDSAVTAFDLVREKPLDVEVLQKWKKKKLDKALMIELGIADLAALLSAYLVVLYTTKTS